MTDLEKRYQILYQKLCNPANELYIERILDIMMSMYHECVSPQISDLKNFKLYMKRYASAAEEVASFRINTKDFNELKVIGRGAFAEVKLVRHKETKNLYAMKILSKIEMSKRSEQAFFWEERDIIANANSQWIVSLHYAFQDEKFLYMVMDYMPGGDFIYLMCNYNIPESWAQFYIAELILAIDALHKYGYIHRDIKPNNMLLDRNGHLKLAGFVSSLKMDKDGLIHSDVVVGTPDYITPEALAYQGGEGVYGQEYDYWAVGIILYELILGDLPFSDVSLMGTYGKIMDHENTLKFPDNIEMSSSCKNLISALLTSRDKRLGRYGIEDIQNHAFFKTVYWDWNNIQSTVAPLIPELSSDDDTSNFEVFPEVDSGCETFESSKGFVGNHFPFIGFSYSKYNRITEGNEQYGFSDEKGRQIEDRIRTLEIEIQAEIQTRLENIKLMQNGTEGGGENEVIEELKKALKEQKTLKIQAVSKLAEIMQKNDSGIKDSKIKENDHLVASSELKKEENEYKRIQLLLKQEREQYQSTEIKLRNEIYELGVEIEKQKEKLKKILMELSSKNMTLEQLQEENKNLNIEIGSLQMLAPTNTVTQQVNLKLEGWLSIFEKKNNRHLEWKKQYVVVSKQKIFFFNNEQDKAANTPAMIIDIGKLIDVHTVTPGYVYNAKESPKVFKMVYFKEGQTKIPKEKNEEVQAEEKAGSSILFKDHQFVVMHYHMPNACDLCQRQMWHMIKPPPAVECRRCHLKCHMDHIDREETFIQACKVTVHTTKNLLVLTNDVDERKQWVTELSQKIKQNCSTTVNKIV